MFNEKGCYGNNHGSGHYNAYNTSSDMNNMNNCSIAPPSGDRRNPSRPAFANRNRNFSNGMYSKNGNYSSGPNGSKPCAVYDDGFPGTSNRYDKSSFGNRFGNNSGGMCGSGKYNGFDNSSSGDRFGNNSGGMCGSGKYNRFDNSSCGDRFGNNSGGMSGPGKYNSFDNYSSGDRFG